MIDFNRNIMHYVIARKNRFESIFLSNFFLSKPGMGINYIDIVLDHKNPL